MSKLIRITSGVLVLVVVLALLLTSIPGGPLHGQWLLVHMMASGALVMLLPAFAISWLAPAIRGVALGRGMVIAYWGLVVGGFITIATMFISMLPLAGTDTLHSLIVVHGYAGFAMAIAAIAFALGWVVNHVRV